MAAETPIGIQAKAHAHHPNYVKVWAVLVTLLVVSLLGSRSHIRNVVLVAAFGVAVAKAYLVAKNFMHVTIEKRWVPYLLVMCLLFLAILFAGVAPDVMKQNGENWNKSLRGPSTVSATSPAAKHE